MPLIFYSFFQAVKLFTILLFINRYGLKQQLKTIELIQIFELHEIFLSLKISNNVHCMKKKCNSLTRTVYTKTQGKGVTRKHAIYCISNCHKQVHINYYI